MSAGNLKRAYCVRLETDGEVGRWAAVKANASTVGIYIHGRREVQCHQFAIGKLDGFLGEWYHIRGEHFASAIGCSHSQLDLTMGELVLLGPGIAFFHATPTTIFLGPLRSM